jgi:AraC-like DNA-binding protein
MILRVYKPEAALQHFISRIMLVHYQLDPTGPKPTNPFPPNPEHCLYFYPYDRIICHSHNDCSAVELPRSIIVGPKLCKVDLTMGHNTLVIIVTFRPGGLHRLLRAPMNEILNQSIDTTLLFGKETDDVIEQLNRSFDADRMVQVIQQFLLKKAKGIKSDLPVDQVLASMLRYQRTINVDQLAKESCVSIRQLERQFKERTGLSPKTFLRLVRFSRAWTMCENDPHISWLKIAHACEYADQMHMIRDFKDFTGATPGALQNDLEKSPLRLQHISC